jgi:uncharacterized integral membrane protein
MKSLGTIVLVIGTIVVVIIGLMNGATAALSLFGAQLTVPSGALLVGGYLSGVACTFALLANRYGSASKSNQRLVEWQAQDEKLLGQVQTDREKQLEAKIATLEAALQRALKKS